MSNSESNRIRKYYNDHNMRRLIRDYVNGNPRFDKAVECIVNCGRRSFARILDIGCGIGYSSYLLKAAFPSSSVLGLDISNFSIQTAGKLFRGDGLKFECKDFLIEDVGGSYDLIVMVDVYEHFPLRHRKQLHKKIDTLLSEDGWLILTTPTVEHQRFLQNHNPDGLQVIDEEVSEDDLFLLANAVHTSVVRYEKVAVWNTYDYQHFVARRTPEFAEPPQSPQQGWIQKCTSKVMRKIKPDQKRERSRHVRRALKIDPVELIENGRVIPID